MSYVVEKDIDLGNGLVGEIGMMQEYGEEFDPRQNDNLCIMVTAHRNYNLGDAQVQSGDEAISSIVEQDGVTVTCDTCKKELYEDSEGTWLHDEEDEDKERRGFDPNTFAELCEGKSFTYTVNGVFMRPLYLMDHSGISISMSSFACPWDSGQVGLIYLTHEVAKENWPDLDGEALEARVVEVMEAEVKEYDAYLTGDIYYYSIEDENGTTVDSCCGYLGDEKYCREAMTESAEHYGSLDSRIERAEAWAESQRIAAERFNHRYDDACRKLAALVAEKDAQEDDDDVR